MAAAMASFGHGLQQPPPFTRLPPEIRLMIYDFAINEHLEKIECSNYLTAFKGSAMSLHDVREVRLSEMCELLCKHTMRPAQYLGVLALLHTSEKVYQEILHALEDAVRRHVQETDLRCE